MKKPAISVIMSVYDAEQYLSLAIQSILSQTFSDFEFLILNDGSTDDSKNIIDKYSCEDSRIRPIHRENKGLIFSLNQLLEESRGDLIARMDGDDIALPDRFDKQIGFLDSNPNYGVVGTSAIRIDGSGNILKDQVDIFPASHEEFVASIGIRPLLCHPSVLYSRELASRVGGYHPSFKHCEDFDLWLRLSNITQVCSIPEKLMLYRMYENQTSNVHVIEQQINAGIAIVCQKLRSENKPDPTQALPDLPPLEGLDQFFNRPGTKQEVLAWAVPRILHSRRALTTGGIDLIAEHIAYEGPRAELWRTVVRLMVVFREWRAGLRLAQLLLRRSFQPASRISKKNKASN